MKKIALAALAISLIATPAAFAQQQNYKGGHYGHQQDRVVKKRVVTKTVVVKKTRWSRGHALPYELPSQCRARLSPLSFEDATARLPVGQGRQ